MAIDFDLFLKNVKLIYFRRPLQYISGRNLS